MGVSQWIAEDLGEDDDPFDRGLVPIESEGSRDAYADMVQFAETVGERRAADLLQRSLHGRGAFGRFRDTLYDFPDLRAQWSTYARARSETRAIEWLAAEGHVDSADTDRELAVRAATTVAVLAAIGRPERLQVEVAEVADRWSDIERTLNAGHDVTLLRDGQPWATIIRTSDR